MDVFYLDAGPMIRALSENPEAFEIRRNCLRHRPSRHWLIFDANGNAHIFARCSCAELPISREQSKQLREVFTVWEETYWRPLMARETAERRVAEINREFARHFGPKTRWQRAVDAVLEWFGVRALQPRFHIDPSLPEDAELHAGPPLAAGSSRNELTSA
jgi:hypothetical protein